MKCVRLISMSYFSSSEYFILNFCSPCNSPRRYMHKSNKRLGKKLNINLWNREPLRNWTGHESKATKWWWLNGNVTQTSVNVQRSLLWLRFLKAPLLVDLIIDITISSNQKSCKIKNIFSLSGVIMVAFWEVALWVKFRVLPLALFSSQ